jgi:hypothetical protein
MATYSQDSGTLHLSLHQGDELGTVIDFTPTNLTGYTVSSSVVSLACNQTVAAITTSIVTPTAGIVSLSMTEAQTAALPVGSYRWNLYWDAPGSVRRTALGGVFEVKQR